MYGYRHPLQELLADLVDRVHDWLWPAPAPDSEQDQPSPRLRRTVVMRDSDHAGTRIQTPRSGCLE